MTIATPAAVRSASKGSSRVSSIVSPDRMTSLKARSHVTGVSLAGAFRQVASTAPPPDGTAHDGCATPAGLRPQTGTQSG